MLIGWYFMWKWLEDYIYGIDIFWDIFLIVGGVILLIVILIVSVEFLKVVINLFIDNLCFE